MITNMDANKMPPKPTSTMEGLLPRTKGIKNGTVDLNANGVSIDNNAVKIKREIGLIHSIGIIAGVIIGSGIFVSPVAISQNCGSVGMSLIVWVVSGLLSALVVHCYTELAAIFPAEGGEYAYLKAVLGPFPAFIHAWVCLVAINPIFFAILALTTGNYIFKPIFPDCDIPDIAVNLFSVWIIVTIAFVNSTYVRYVTRVQTTLMFVKLSLLVIIIIVGFIHIIQGKTENLQDPFKGTTSNPGSIAIAIYSGIFSYGGWQYVFNLLEEVKNPYKTVPRATILSFALVIVVYFLANLSYFVVMTTDELTESKAVAVTFAQKTLGLFSLAVPVFVACSTTGALNGSMMGGSRVYFAAARDGLFPSFLSLIHKKYLTPWPSLLFQSLISVVYVVSGDAISLMESLGFIAMAIQMFCLGSLLYLRYTQPQLHRPVKVNLAAPIFSMAVILALLVLGFLREPMQYGIGLLICATGLPVYMICHCIENKPASFNKYMLKITVIIQKLFLVVHEDVDPSEK